MQKLMSLMRAAMEKYDMVAQGDRIAVGVSGGKDSVTLLSALAGLRRFYPKHFDLVAISIDMRFNDTDSDFTKIAELCMSLGVEYKIKRTELASVIFNVREEKNPCSLCAKMRRGMLHDFAKELGCNKLALGHHLDDAAETFIMNLFRGGNIACFRPVTYLSRKDLTMIRPMIFVKETAIISLVNKLNLPVVKSKCPIDGCSERQRVKEMLRNLETDYPALRDKIIGALERGEIDGWHILGIRN